MTSDISIIIPTYNRRNFLEQAIRSCELQYGVACEIIIVDDGSTDDSETFCSRLPHVRYFKQENCGPGAARNLGMKHAQGEFIKFLDDDDVLVPHSLAHQVDALRQSSADMSYSSWSFCNEYLEQFGSIEGLEVDVPSLDFLATGWWYPAFAYTFRRAFLEKHACIWDEEFHYIADLNFILNVAVHHPVPAWSPVLSGLYRRHDVQLSNSTWHEREKKRVGILRNLEDKISDSHLHKIILSSKTSVLTALYQE